MNRSALMFVCTWVAVLTERGMASPDQPIQESLETTQSYAAQGDPTARYNLGVAYLQGEKGVAKDAKRAAEWFLQAAQLGFPPAELALGALYGDGKEVPRNEAEAAKWMTLAAEHGEFQAQRILVGWYARGQFVKKDPVAALRWDFRARRTLELRHEKPAGDPPQPPSVRADGAAEMKNSDGTISVIHADGGVETKNPDGSRAIRYDDGHMVLVQTNGVRETRWPGGFIDIEYPDGRKTKRDPKGVEETTFPDGHRELVGKSTDRLGREVKITEIWNAKGGKVGRRIVRGNQTMIEDAKRIVAVETLLNDETGVAMKLTEEVKEGGTPGKAALIRVDTGAGPKAGEYWKIQRVIESDNKAITVKEVYTADGLQGQSVVETKPLVSMPMRTVVAGMPAQSGAPDFVTVPMYTPPPPPTFAPFGGGGESVYKVPTNIDPMLKELAALEKEARHFAGATVADWQRLKTETARYVIPLTRPPQKVTPGPSWMTVKQLSSSMLAAVPLNKAVDDGSRTFPFGHHGKEAIRSRPWKHAQTAHFIVHYLEDSDARFTMQYLEAAYTVLSTLLNLDPARGGQKAHVFLFANDADWKSYLINSKLSQQLGGFAYKNELLLPTMVEKGGREESVKVLCHETTHAVFSRFYPGCKVPLWFTEGLAEYIAARTVAAKRGHAVEKYFGKADQPMALPDVFNRVKYGSGSPLYGGSGIGAFYANAERCVFTLCEKLPPEGFPMFVNLLAAGNSPEACFRAAYAKDCPDVKTFTTLVNGK